MSLPKLAKRQRGVVLIMAMLIVALVVSITIALAWKFQLSVSRGENRWHGAQARAYLEGAETLAIKVLLEDLKNDDEDGFVDALDEIWAEEAPPFPTDEGWVQGRIEDAAGRLNLNLLAKPPGAPKNKASPEDWEKYNTSQKQLIRLIQTIELGEEGPLERSAAEAIADSIKDWIDGDDNVSGFGGAESDYYEQLEPAYSAPNSPMASVSELQLIKGVTPELYNKLLPFVVALPEDVGLNINTAPEGLLRALNDKKSFQPLSEADAQTLLEDRPQEGYEKVEELKDSPVFSTVAAGDMDWSGLAVKSDYFIVYSQALVGEQLRSGTTLLWRDATPNKYQVQVIRRSDANL